MKVFQTIVRKREIARYEAFVFSSLQRQDITQLIEVKKEIIKYLEKKSIKYLIV